MFAAMALMGTGYSSPVVGLYDEPRPRRRNSADNYSLRKRPALEVLPKAKGKRALRRAKARNKG